MSSDPSHHSWTLNTLNKALHFLQTASSLSTSCLADSFQLTIIWMEIEENKASKTSGSKGHKEFSCYLQDKTFI